MSTETQMNGVPSDAASSSNAVSSSGSSANGVAPVAVTQKPGAATQATGTQQAAGQVKTTEKKKRVVDRFNPSNLEAESDKALQRSDGNTDGQVRADAAQLSAAASPLRSTAGEVVILHDQVASARITLKQEDGGLRKVLTPVRWWLREQPGGRKFVRDCKGSSCLEVTTKLMKALPAAGFTVPADLLSKLSVQQQKAQAASDAYDHLEKERVAAIARYEALRARVKAAVSALRASLRRSTAMKKLA